ncbi:MAG TPA: phytanoyl-CoA dioxygenase family protein [Puia sp.]|jgi:ectoine hydroxylase-related dioxygenase (phytanoyl-CoA dioxygenase family)
MSNVRVRDEREVNFYRENGYLLTGRPLFSPGKFERLFVLFEEHLANRGDLKPDELDVPHMKDDRLFDFLMADEVLDVVEPLIGPNIGLWSSHFISKEPRMGNPTPWHEDSAYWNGRFDRMDMIVTVWLAIDKADVENGCMGVVPGTHRNGTSEYEKMDTDNRIFNIRIKGEVDESKVVWLELEKNFYSLHDSRIIHGARANTSQRRRTGYTMRYFSNELVFNREHPHNLQHRIFHCRGENVAGNPLIYL